MSVIAYARMTRRREESRPAEPGATLMAEGAQGKEPPVGKATIDVFAALVPAEVLLAHAVILQVTTETRDGQTTITEPGTLKFAFWTLALAAAAAYVIAKAPGLDRWDYVRALIPALAFVGWTMVQKSTAFDAAFTINEAIRITIPVIAAVVISAAAAALAYKADEKEG